MFNLEEIRQMVVQGRVPDSWRVVRGSAVSGTFLALHLWIACMLTIPIIMTVGLLLKLFIFHTAIEYTNNMKNVIIIFSLFVTLECLLIAYQHTRRAKNSIIVFLPGGCLELLNVSSTRPAPSTWHAIWYAQTASLYFDVDIVGNVFLNAQTHDGIQYRWVLNPYYGNRVRLAQDILTAYTTYTVLHRVTIVG